MRFSIQSIKKLVTTGTWKIDGTWDAIGFVAGPSDGSCSLSRRFPQFRDSLPCCGQKSRGEKGNLRDNGTDGRSILSSPTRIRATHHSSHCFEIREIVVSHVFRHFVLVWEFLFNWKKDLFRILIEIS